MARYEWTEKFRGTVPISPRGAGNSRRDAAPRRATGDHMESGPGLGLVPCRPCLT